MTIMKEEALASFYTVNKAPIKHLRVYFSPKQAGSGTASPENVREISGWNQLYFSHSQKSLVEFGSVGPYNYYFNGYNAQWINTAQQVVPVTDRSQYYTYSCYIDNTNGTATSCVQVWFKDITNTKYLHVSAGSGIAAGTAGRSFVTFKPSSNDYYLGLGISLKEGAIASEGMLEIGNIMTEYEPYKGSLQTIDWSNDAGTIYGGYIDLITGELVQEYGYVEANWGDFTLDKANFADVERRGYSLQGLLPPSGAQNRAQLSNLAVYQYGYQDNVVHIYVAINNIGYVFLPPNTSDNTHIQITYKLATPIIHQLTPQSLATFLGRNNIWSNADRVEVEYDLAESNDELYRRRNIILQGAPHLETATGNIANFKTDLIAPIKEAKVYFEPIQAGSGDPSPNNVREITSISNLNLVACGTNLFDSSTGIELQTNNIRVARNKGQGVPILLKRGITYTLSTNSTVPVSEFLFQEPYTANSYARGGWDGFKYSYTPDIDIEVGLNTYWSNEDGNRPSNATNLQLEVGSEKTNFETYNGTTFSIDLPILGKNLFNKNAIPYQTGKYIYDVVGGIPQYSNNSHYNVYRIPIKPATTYTFGPIKGGNSGSGPIWATTHGDGIASRYVFNAGGSAGITHTFTSYSSDRYLLLSIAIDDEYGYKCNDILQVEEGSTATAYEPYEYIYGGYIDLLTGEIKCDWVKKKLTDFTWHNYTAKISYYTFLSVKYDGVSYKRINTGPIYSDTLKIYNDSAHLSRSPSELTYNNGYNLWIMLPEAMESDAAHAWIAQNYPDASICFQIESPITIGHINPIQLKTIKGTNNIWSSANGPVSIKYWTH